MSYCGGPMAVSNNTAGSGSLPVGSNAAGYNSSMQAPNNSAIGSSSAGDASITNERLELEKRIRILQNNMNYFEDQAEGARQDLHEVESKQSVYVACGKTQE